MEKRTHKREMPKVRRARRWTCDVCGFLALSEREKFRHLDENTNDPAHLAGRPIEMNAEEGAKTADDDDGVKEKGGDEKSDEEDEGEGEKQEDNILQESDEDEPWNK